MKKISKWNVAACLMVCLLLVSLLTGCMQENMDFTVKEDGSCSYALKVLLQKDVYDKMASLGGEEMDLEEMLGEGYEVGLETISGMQYYSFNRKFEFGTVQELKKFMTDDETYRRVVSEGVNDASIYEEEKAPFSFAEISSRQFIAKIATSSETTDISVVEEQMEKAGLDNYADYLSQNSITILVSVTLPDTITESNGINSGKTTTWNLDVIPDDGKLIAVTGNNTIISSDKTAPVIKGIKNKGFYNKAVILKASDNISLTKLLLDGKSYNRDSLKVSRDGKHTAVATDANKNTTTAAFTIDTVKPVIKGAKNGKSYKKKVTLKFSDKYGIKSVKVNGKKGSTKKIILKKKKKYTVKVTDKAGNTTTVKFRIKK